MADKAKTTANRLRDNLFDPSDVYNFLFTQNALPTWVPTTPLGDASGTYTPSAHTVVALPPERARTGTGTLSHEMTHAAQSLITAAAELLREKQWSKQKLDPSEVQFLNTYLKLMGDLPGRVAQFKNMGDPRVAYENIQKSANAMLGNADMSASYKSYRTQPKELQAFGVGDMAAGSRADEGHSNHLNPSFATEFSILMGAYNRIPSTTRQDAVKLRMGNVPLKQVDESKWEAPLTNYSNPFLR